ncbi:DUF695 domain-containing protein [bacterium]|nr:DUF695 domain-containing protein [bacterium]
MAQKGDWFIANSIKEGHEIITRGRKDLKTIMDSKEYDIRIEIYWNYQANDEGMPDKHIQDLMDKMEEVLSIKVESEEIGYQTTNFVGNNQRIWVWYTKDVEKFGETLNNTLSMFPKLPLKIISTNDPDWTDYQDILTKCSIII